MSCGQYETERRKARAKAALFSVALVRTTGQLEALRGLFREYGRTPHVEACVVGFDQEIAGLPGPYAEPEGALLIASVGGQPVGCVALRPIDQERAELKRLYVRPEFRGRRIGEALTTTLIDAARARGVTRLRLDTLPAMVEARALYARLGFVEVPPYVAKPLPGVCYLERRLS